MQIRVYACICILTYWLNINKLWKMNRLLEVEIVLQILIDWLELFPSIITTSLISPYVMNSQPHTCKIIIMTINVF